MKADTARLAEIHAACFSATRPWSAVEFDTLLKSTGTILIQKQHGFVLARAVLDETEILTIAVLASSRRRGMGQRLLGELELNLRAKGINSIYLEVSASNAAALALYYSSGFLETGRRSGYYASTNGSPQDALILSKILD